MPVYEYSVLKGTPTSGSLSKDKIPHYLINVTAGSDTWQVAFNIESSDGSEVLYYLDENFTPPSIEALDALDVGATTLAGTDGNPAIDYLRTKVNNTPLVTQEQMIPLPKPGKSGSDKLQNAVIQFLNQAVADPGASIYAFGSRYTDGTNGIHDIHMNQGNPTNSFGSENGIWQDGLLIFELPGSSTWAAIFIAFQTESWTTDDNGNPD